MTSYRKLKNQFSEYTRKIRVRRTVFMWRYPKDKLKDSWRLDDLYERVATAQSLGWEARLTAEPDGLRVEYVQALPDAPRDCRGQLI